MGEHLGIDSSSIWVGFGKQVEVENRSKKASKNEEKKSSGLTAVETVVGGFEGILESQPAKAGGGFQAAK